MGIRYLQLLVTALAIEMMVILLLAILVGVFGAEQPEQAQTLLEELSYWFNPIAGFIFCFLGAYLLTRNMHYSRIPNGILLGLLVAIIDISILTASDAEFQIVFLVSYTGRIVAGALGSYVAEKQAL